MNTKLPPSEDITLPEIFRRFPDEKSAIEYFESIRWADGVACPHCGNKDEAKMWNIAANDEKKIRHGLRQCAVCKKQFRVTVGTIFEDSHVPLNLWLVAWYLICGAKKGMSALQLKRHLWGDNKGSYKTAWFMAHRIRHAMKDESFSTKLTGIVEADETYVGGKQRSGHKGYSTNKTPVVTVVERGGQKRSVAIHGHTSSSKVTGKTLQNFVIQNVESSSVLVTDENPGYRHMKHVYDHRGVKHGAKEYARKEKDMVVHTNTVESSFSLLKRGIIGSFHHVSRKHLPLYAAEFDFRWNHRKSTDGERTVAALRKADGKRLRLK